MSREHHKKHHKKKQQIIVKSAIRNTWFHLAIKETKSLLLATAHLSRIGKERFKKNVDGANVYFKCFSGANTKQLDYYVVPTLVDERSDSVIIHIGSNDITKSNYNNVNVEDLAKKIINIGVKCKAYKVSNIAITSILVRSDPKVNQVIKQVNRLLQVLCKTNNFYFICSNAIDNTFLWKERLHLTYEGISKLYDNFLEYLTSFLLPSNDYNVNKLNNNLVF